VDSTEAHPRTDLRIDFVPKRDGQPDGVHPLGDLMDHWQPLIESYQQRPRQPDKIGWVD